MPIKGQPQVKRQHVLDAIKECDEEGEPQFLTKHRRGPPIRWVLFHEGKLYPSKAIYRAAYCMATGLSGSGKGQGADILKKLGFPILDKTDKGQMDGEYLGTLSWRNQLIQDRIGQPQFRDRLLEAYERKCAISSCSVEAVLEAAHILPYSESADNSTANGILLRADLHTLFDRGFLRVPANANYKVTIDESIQDKEYRRFDGKVLSVPDNKEDQPNKLLLDKREQFGFELS